MVPLDARGRGHRLGARIADGVLPDHRLLTLPVGHLERGRQRADAGQPLLLIRIGLHLADGHGEQRVQHGMPVAHEQPATGPQQVGDGLRPAADVGDPAQRTDPGVDEVEALPAERLDGAVHVRLDVVDVEADPIGDPARVPQRVRRQVEPRHPRPEAGEAQRVGAEVALQVHAVEALEVAEAWAVERDDLRDPRGVLDLAQVVAAIAHVDVGPGIPVGAVDVEVVAHPFTLEAPRSTSRRASQVRSLAPCGAG